MLIHSSLSVCLFSLLRSSWQCVATFVYLSSPLSLPTHTCHTYDRKFVVLGLPAWLPLAVLYLCYLKWNEEKLKKERERLYVWEWMGEGERAIDLFHSILTLWAINFVRKCCNQKCVNANLLLILLGGLRLHLHQQQPPTMQMKCCLIATFKSAFMIIIKTWCLKCSFQRFLQKNEPLCLSMTTSDASFKPLLTPPST